MRLDVSCYLIVVARGHGGLLAERRLITQHAVFSALSESFLVRYMAHGYGRKPPLSCGVHSDALTSEGGVGNSQAFSPVSGAVGAAERAEIRS